MRIPGLSRRTLTLCTVAVLSIPLYAAFNAITDAVASAVAVQKAG